jgi:protein involved in polysaccharide export with SLBB domain
LLPPEIAGCTKNNYQAVPLNALSQPQPDSYKLDSGDVLGVFIDGFIGEKNVPLPVHIAPLVLLQNQNRLAPGAGYPIPVQEDGNVALPGVPKVSVKGMTVGEARDAIANQYFKKELIQRENDRIVVTLMHPRQQQVLVLRQEAQAFQAGQDGPVPISKRNTGQVVDLPAYQNDVLHALVRSGGLPELDAYNEIIIYRDGNRDQQQRAEVLKQLENAKGPVELSKAGNWLGETIRLPLRVPQGAPLPFSREDTILHNGDIVFIEARDEEVFFTAGLLPPGRHMLPRDQDLDVIQAVSLVRGPLYNGAFGGSNLSGTLIPPGIGNPSPTLLVVLRYIPGRGQVAIAVSLRDALLHPQERLVIKPGDVLILQETPCEALTRYVTQTFFNFNLFYNVLNTKNGFAIIDVAAPDRLPGRVGTLNQLPQ